MIAKPALVIAFFIMISIIILLLVNLIRYNWKNGELKVRIFFMLWAIFKVVHIISMWRGEHHGWWLLASLSCILAMIFIIRNKIHKPSDPQPNSQTIYRRD